MLNWWRTGYPIWFKQPNTHTYLPLKNKTYCDPIVISVSVTFLLLLTISRVHLPTPVGYLTWYLSLHLNLQYRHRRRRRRYIIIIIRCVLIWKRLLLYQVCCACFHFLHRVSPPSRLVSLWSSYHQQSQVWYLQIMTVGGELNHLMISGA